MSTDRNPGEVRKLTQGDLAGLLALYRALHPDDPVLEVTPALQAKFESLVADPNHHLLGVEVSGQLVSSCVLVVIPNLTRNGRPYALVENVITLPEYRGQGYATHCLRKAQEIAWACQCYKIMLLTGSKQEETLRFYEHAGFQREIKTGFIAYPPDGRVFDVNLSKTEVP